MVSAASSSSDLHARYLHCLDLAHRKKFQADCILGQGVDETGGDDPHLVHLPFQEEVAGKGGNRPGLRELGRVRVGELGNKLPARAGDELRGSASGRNEDRGLDRIWRPAGRDCC